MNTSNETKPAEKDKRKILIAEDEPVNQTLLKMILQEEYELILANDGEETLKFARAYRQGISVILLDLMMPKIEGLDVLHTLKEDPILQKIPVIVMTADQDAEIESLSLGAVDFIPKPYPKADIIRARVLRTIEFSEDRQILNSTERDNLTGLYNREFFFQYAEQMDLCSPEKQMDAIAVDIIHFHVLNDRFGRTVGNMILKSIAKKLREEVRAHGGISCHKEGDKFYAYCPSGLDYHALFEKITAHLPQEFTDGSSILLRMGVYGNVDKSLEMEHRFDRAEMAANTVRKQVGDTIGIYDDKMREKELLEALLVDDFRSGIDEEQFVVYYQPKYNIESDKAILSSAEALVRWNHPKIGQVSPAVFIPLFEENGLIHELDQYVWKKTAAQIAAWKKRIGRAVPVSVNVSRIDLYDPELVSFFDRIVHVNGIEKNELLLEVTESAYAKDTQNIVSKVCSLREVGYGIEMDDFGSGYSSFNMITTIPFDVLKLDMQFIRSVFRNSENLWLLEMMIHMAKHLNAKVVAEGVETADQVKELKKVGCQIVQGYYFSRPLPPEEFEELLINGVKDL